MASSCFDASFHADVIRRSYSFHRLGEGPTFDLMVRSVELWLNLRGLSEGRDLGDSIFVELYLVLVVIPLTSYRPNGLCPRFCIQRKALLWAEGDKGRVKGRPAASLLLSKLNLACRAAICASRIMPSSAFLNWVWSFFARKKRLAKTVRYV